MSGAQLTAILVLSAMDDGQSTIAVALTLPGEPQHLCTAVSTMKRPRL